MKKDCVELEVIDQLHLTSVKADTMGMGERFVTDAATAKSLVERGLAKRVSRAKAAPAPGNKMAPVSSNKVAPPANAKPAAKGGSKRKA
jgi:hypothetical protein